VEITSNSTQLLQPVMGNDTIKNITPPLIRFRPNVAYAEAITSWNITASQEGRALKTFRGASKPPVSVDWVVADDPKTVPQFPGKLDFTLKVTGSHSDEAVASGSIPVEQVSLRKKIVERMADKEIEKFNLLLFDLQSAELNDNNKQVIDLIRSHIKSASTVSIIGHTDRTGDAEKNQKLSLERAKNTARSLGVTSADVRGIGSETILYDNNLPEGRCLSRTVDIIVETPTQTP
jgi:outer membrane protein OmpA-like peptidoglycan-associated protein